MNPLFILSLKYRKYLPGGTKKFEISRDHPFNRRHRSGDPLVISISTP